MVLKEVSLRNWRSYRAATFRFPAPVGKKRVLLVGAMNGTGKTSLLVGLYLGLFGREAMQFVEGVRLGANDEEKFKSYRQLVQQLLHRPALDEDEPRASVELLFENDDRQVRINRTWHYTKGGAPRNLNADGEETRLWVDERPQRIADWRDANNKISAELFPAHVMPCFFFDGEQAQERVEASGAAALSEAIRVLFATGLVDELYESLKIYIDNERSSVKRDIGDVDVDALDRKRRRRDEIEDDLSAQTKELVAVRSELKNLDAARTQKIVELTQLTGDAAIDTGQMAQRKADLAAQERDAGDRLRESLATLALPMVLAKHGKKAEEQLSAEVARDEWIMVRDATKSKVDQIVTTALPRAGDGSIINPALTGGQREALVVRLKNALEALWHPPPAGCAEEVWFRFLQPAERVAARQRIGSLFETTVSDLSALAEDWETLKSRVRELQRQWDVVIDVKPKLEQLKGQLNDLEVRSKELNDKRAGFEARERGLQSELKDLQGAIGQLESARRKLGPVEEKLEVAERVRSALNDVRGDLIPLCKKALEERCTVHFQAMISEEYRTYKVEFDDDLQPFLAGGPAPIAITTLSGAQKRAFGLAFTLAVAEVSGEEAPIVIDTPVGNADSEYRIRILKYLATAARGQVIFLSHDEEIYGPYAECLAPYILKKYLVDFTPIEKGSGISSVREDAYFEDRKKQAVGG